MTDDRPSSTAIMHACFRAEHTTLHHPPIYTDLDSVALLEPRLRGKLLQRRSMLSAPASDALRLMAAIRYRILDEHLPAAHARGVRQLLVLGAGLDTTAFRLPEWAADWCVIEIDHPATQRWKRARIRETGWTLPPALDFVPCDFERESLRDVLSRSAFDSSQPALVTWFGVLLYLTQDAAADVLHSIAGLASGSEILLTYSDAPTDDDCVVREIWDKTARGARDRGESFTSFYTDNELRTLIETHGLELVSIESLDSLNARYFAGRADGLRLRDIERIAIVRVM